MANQIKLIMPKTVEAFREFNIVVQLVGATPHRWETIKVVQRSGPEPRAEDRLVQIQVQADGSGTGITTATLQAPGRAQFCPEDPDGQYFGRCKAVDVRPRG